jgi:hypothetical protein
MNIAMGEQLIRAASLWHHDRHEIDGRSNQDKKENKER